MAVQTLRVGSGQRLVDQISVTQNSVDAETAVAGSGLDSTFANAVSYTLENTGANSIDVTVYRANQAGVADEVQDGAIIAIAAGARATYVDAPAGFRFYRLKVKATTPGSQGTLVANGFAH